MKISKETVMQIIGFILIFTLIGGTFILTRTSCRRAIEKRILKHEVEKHKKRIIEKLEDKLPKPKFPDFIK